MLHMAHDSYFSTKKMNGALLTPFPSHIGYSLA